jgi:hypothetical protein
MNNELNSQENAEAWQEGLFFMQLFLRHRDEDENILPMHEQLIATQQSRVLLRVEDEIFL